MNYTKNDLSHNEAALDLEALKTTSGTALAELMETISNYLGKLRDDNFNKDYTGVHCNARWLKQAADKLVIVAETHATLKGTETRENIKIRR